MVVLRRHSTSYTIERYGDEKIIHDVLHVSGLAKNLFSAKQLDKASGEVHTKVGIFTLINKFGQLIATCMLNLDLHELSLAIPTTTYLNKAYLWHLRLRHINQKRLKQFQMISKGIEPFDKNEKTLCQTCIDGKQQRENLSNQATLRAIECWK